MLLQVLIALILALGLFLIISNTDIQLAADRVRDIRQIAKQRRRQLIRASALGSRLEYVERIIQKSNIRIYIPYSVTTHMLMCIVFFILGFLWMQEYMSLPVAIVFGVGMGTIPFLLLKILTDIISYKVKQISVDFLIILKNFLIAGKSNDIFLAFQRTAEYVSEPLKSYINIMVFENEYKINPLQCLDNFLAKLEVSELKLFIENLKICYIYGGDVIALIDTFIEEIGDQNEDEDEEKTEDILLNMGLYILLLINFIVMYFLMNSSYRYSVLQPVWGQVIFALDVVISIYIVIQSINKLQA